MAKADSIAPNPPTSADGMAAHPGRPADSMAATFLVVAPDGSVTYDFDGHVHAEGLDLDEGVGGDPPSEHRLRWLDAAGVARHEAFGRFFDAGAGESIMQVSTGSDSAGRRDQARIDLMALASGGESAHLRAFAHDAGNTSRCSATAGSSVRNIVTKAGSSDFAQVLAEPGLRIIRGIVNTAGSGSIVEGAGFTLTREGTGVVRINFSTAFGDVPAVAATIAADGFSAGARDMTVQQVRLTKAVPGTYSDGVISFVAIGPN